jgi:uncharacterized protein YdhG (YjbR/CyaY superfamily)
MTAEMAMKAAKASRARRTADESSSNDEAIAAYLAQAPVPARALLSEIRNLVRDIVPPETSEVFSYGMPGFRYKGALLWYGAFKNHCGFYPGSPPMLRSLAEELKGFKTTKGAIQFPTGKPLPAALVKKIVRLRLAENDARELKRSKARGG